MSASLTQISVIRAFEIILLLNFSSLKICSILLYVVSEGLDRVSISNHPEILYLRNHPNVMGSKPWSVENYCSWTNIPRKVYSGKETESNRLWLCSPRIQSKSPLFSCKMGGNSQRKGPWHTKHTRMPYTYSQVSEGKGLHITSTLPWLYINQWKLQYNLFSERIH